MQGRETAIDTLSVRRKGENSSVMSVAAVTDMMVLI